MGSRFSACLLSSPFLEGAFLYQKTASCLRDLEHIGTWSASPATISRQGESKIGFGRS